MIRSASSARLLACTGFALALACGKEPALNVQSQAAAQPSQAATEPEAAAAESPAMALSNGAATPTALPPGHPPTGGMPAGHPPIDAAAQGALQVAPVAPETGQGVNALVWTTAPTWAAEPPSNSMRRAQYKIPGPGGEGECVVFYFGPGQGGDAQSNAERWASQFTGADGQPVAARTATRDVHGIDVLLVEAAGTYQAGSMVGMGEGVTKADWALLGAIAEGPDGNWFFKLTAPRATIEANRAAFERLIESLARGG
jgi:hypothetical protein